MQGLIIKDIISLKQQYKTILVMFVFFTAFSIASGNSGAFGGIVSIMLVMLTITSMSYDEYSKWDKYALTMPVSRADLVFAKYILGLLLSGLALIFNLVFQLIIAQSLKEAFAISFALFGVSILFLLIILPFMFKYGVEKGRLIMMLVLFIPTGIVIVMSKSGLNPLNEPVLSRLPYLLPLALLFIAVISVLISLRIFGEKEM